MREVKRREREIVRERKRDRGGVREWGKSDKERKKRAREEKRERERES